jgi:hypothetical protein
MNTEIETLKQEFEEIQTAFLPKEETKPEEAFYTKNVEEWLEFIKEPKVDLIGEYVFDYEIIKNAEAFSLGPVFCYNGKMEACSSVEYGSLNDLKNSLKGKKYLVYYILCRVVSEPVGPIESEDFIITYKDKFVRKDRIGKNPKTRYTFRGHILE